ncbi:hypothetical protein L211DRAFT_841813 [Terfezia boudieri ATCC MYA-4762]|uniref:Diphthine--ammonia ligase n=1 Tax=Terfezia boudieri ATCC MYA-4762 TaxID=1051890 RepID=A0A3N4LF25_9PEZI|nr:hypothetical protein L211DRAFT_841813 [Terfezia boudieri ATCC MYA-4762]
MDVIALISGGKDSFFSLLHCIKNGHRIVALANLHPPAPDASLGPEITTCLPAEDLDKPIPLSTNVENDELDSFMYQTIGHNLLPYYATALNLPLYRTSIVGSSVNQCLSYKLEKTDETEDLHRLLEYVRKKHPGASAVCSGAILSTYQRTRVENVCGRLGLISLSYLWQRPQNLLLDEMASAGLDARIVKVAAIGLDPDSFLWQNVTSRQVRMKLRILKDRWGVHIAGEGGEYETIVVEGPGWRTRLAVDNRNGDALKLIVGDSGVGHLKILKAGWEKIGDGRGEEQANWVRDLRKPQLLNKYFRKIFEAVGGGEESGEVEIEKQELEVSLGSAPGLSAVHGSIPVTSYIIGNNITINNISAPNSSKEMMDIMALLKKHLAKYHGDSNPSSAVSDWSSWFAKITHITLLLRSMADFGTVNASYNQYFLHPNPPARVCVAIGDAMPAGCNILVHVQASTSCERRGLHIQGRSYWAPANIGPYSQAISTQGLVYISGQIPLASPTMDLPRREDLPGGSEGGMLEFQTVLAMQHMWRVARAMKVSGYASVMGYTTNSRGADIMNRVWIRHISIEHQSDSDSDNDGEEDNDTPNPKLWESAQDEDLVDQTPYEGEDMGRSSSVATDSTNVPPLLVVQVPELPRGVPVEWVALGIDEECNPKAPYQDIDDNDSDEVHRYETRKWTILDKLIPGVTLQHIRTWNYRKVPYGSVIRLGMITTPAGAALAILKLIGGEQPRGLAAYVATVYLATEGAQNTVPEFYREWEGLCDQSELRDLLQVVPVERVWFGGREVKVGVVVRLVKCEVT